MLGAAEALWKKKQHQPALASLDVLLAKEATSADCRVEAKLLKSAILRDTGSASGALVQVEEALDIAKSYDELYNLCGKAQFHRGVCLFELARFEEARWALNFASKAAGCEKQVQLWKELTATVLQDSGTDSNTWYRAMSREDPAGRFPTAPTRLNRQPIRRR